MKRSHFIIVLAIVFSLALFGAQFWASERIYQMTGDIIAIDLEYNTVVIEVPLAGKTFSTGGPLSYEAILKKGHQAANLLAFQVGNRVKVNGRLPDKATLFYHLMPNRNLDHVSSKIAWGGQTKRR